MKLPIYQVDAFTSSVFSGNPAAVVPLNHWLPDHVMQQIAIENALAETAFFIPLEKGYGLRWFTPEIEMDLCGHATLATAHVIARHLEPSLTSIQFESNSGPLTATIGVKLITLDFPSRKPLPAEAPQVILEAFQQKPLEILKSRDYFLVYNDEEVIRNLKPNQVILDQINLNPGGIIVTAPGREVDFVSRFFTPQASIFEDPVTGSAHCSLIPYWSERLGKISMIAKQLSSRGGKLICEAAGERVFISGEAVTYLEGFITV